MTHERKDVMPRIRMSTTEGKWIPALGDEVYRTRKSEILAYVIADDMGLMGVMYRLIDPVTCEQITFSSELRSLDDRVLSALTLPNREPITEATPD